ncbi:PilN domain-containing protein [Thioalkalicoccus limnaeus]|uniref:PilN domain-containing protein n=1 Tax=Thioalkalicoccus limnaeus TaxID=120681 RepID=A0ABV4BH97_9GAMM
MRVIEQLKGIRSAGLRFDRDTLAEWWAAYGVCLPGAWRRWFLARDRRLLVIDRGGRADLFIATGDDRSPVGELDKAGTSVLPPIAGASTERTVLVIGAEQVLRRTLSLPLQVRENLAQVMRYEIDRFSPFAADQVYMSFAARPSRQAERLEVDLAICRRAPIQPWLERLRGVGRPVDQLTWEGAWPRANLLDPADRPPHKIQLVTSGRLFALAVFALLVAILISPLWQRTQFVEEIERDLRRVRVEAIQVDEVRQSLDQAREGSQALLRQKAQQPLMADLLRELTLHLPDDTWIQNLDVQGQEVQLRGESARATALIERLERVPGFEGVAFRSPVTQVAQTGMERFHLMFRYGLAAQP